MTTAKSVIISATSSTVVTSSTMTMSVASIAVTLTTNKGGQTQATANVSVRDSHGNPVAGAAVSGTWSGAISGSASGTTSTSGVASISSSRTKSSGTFTYTVTGVSLTGYTYAPANNTETSDSATR